MQCFEHRHALAHACGLDTKHLATEIAAQVGDIVEVRRLSMLRRARQLAEFFNQLRNSDQLFGEIRAVLKDIEREARHLGIGIEQRQETRIRHHLFEKMLEGSGTAPELHSRDR